MSMHSFLAVMLVAAGFWLQTPKDWTAIVPQATTQAELTMEFGPPDEVVATFPWSEWSATWKRRPVTRNYLLRYAKERSQSRLLNGPAGPADSVDVHIADKKVIAVEWMHGGPTARAAAARIRADPEVRSTNAHEPLKWAKDAINGTLSFEVASDDSQVRAFYQMK